jgi:tetratricopeptide (TPR) repeat protein
MSAKILIFVLLFSALNFDAQKINPQNTNQTLSNQNSQSNTDELTKHLSAAETYQISGDLANAAVENRAIVGIALQRIGDIAIEEGNYKDAVKFLKQSIIYLDDAPNRTNLAIAYLRLNQLDNAAEEAQKAIVIDAKYAGAHYILGNIYFTKEDYKSALPELEKVLLLAPDFDSARALGLTYLYLKQPERAKLLFEEMLSSVGKDSPDLHVVFGQAYEQTNYPLEAEREFKRALEIDPKHPRASFFLGYVILQHGGSDRLNEAGKAFEGELKLSPDEFYANFFAGVVASSISDHEKAVGFFAKAIKANPKRSASYLFLGQSQLELNDLPSAEKSLRQAIELSKTDAKDDFEARRTHFLLGRLLVKTNRKEEGEKELLKARELQEKSIKSARDEISQILGQVVGETKNPAENNGNNWSDQLKPTLSPERIEQIKKIKPYLSEILAQAFHNLGVIAVQNNQPDNALENFAFASEWKADFPGLNRNWGIVAFRSGQFDKAITPLERHLKANLSDNLIRQMLGASYYFTNNFTKAVETLKPLETVLTSDAELAYFYGISLIQLKRNQEAVPIFNKLAAISQKTPEALFYAAQGFMILGDYGRAVKEFRTVVALAPDTAKANYFIGQSLIRLNRYDEAESAFKAELALDPNDVLSKYHLALTLIERKIEPEKTIEILEETINLKSDYADARYQLGKIYLEKGETQKAVEQLEAAVSADANKDFIHYQLSIAYRKMSRKDDADRELKRYQELKAAIRKIDAPMGNK